jgi:hypothetical protein
LWCNGKEQNILIKISRGADIKDVVSRYKVTLQNETTQPTLHPASALICPNTEFSIEGAPSSASIEWTKSSTNLYLLSSYNTATTQLLSSNSKFGIDATVTDGVCEVPLHFSYYVPEPIKEPEDFKFTGYTDSECKEPEFTFSIPSFSIENTQATYDWTFTTNGYTILNQTTYNTQDEATATVQIDYPGDGKLLEVTATVVVNDLCGQKKLTYTKTIDYYEKCKKGGWEMVVNPNPAHDEVFIDFWKESTPKGENDGSETQIKIISAFEGIKYISTTTEKEGVNIPLYGIENGLYYVQLLTSDGVMTSKVLIIQKE